MSPFCTIYGWFRLKLRYRVPVRSNERYYQLSRCGKVRRRYVSFASVAKTSLTYVLKCRSIINTLTESTTSGLMHSRLFIYFLIYFSHSLLFVFFYFLLFSSYGKQPTEPPQPTKKCPRRNGFFAHPEPSVCNVFYNCIDGEAIEITCTTGLHFDEYSGTCVWPDSAGREVKQLTTTIILLLLLLRL